MNALAVSAIHAYRRHVSPYKGFRCAHNVLHGAGSCSDFGLKLFERRPLPLALAMLRQRFAECKSAKARLVAMAATGASGAGDEEDEEERRRRHQQGQSANNQSASNKSNDWSCSGVDGCSGIDACSGADACSCSW